MAAVYTSGSFRGGGGGQAAYDAMVARQNREKEAMRQRAAAQQAEVQRLDIQKATSWETKKAKYTQQVASENLARQMAAAAGQVSAQQASARQANLQRYSQLMSIYGGITKRYERGGAFEKAGLAQIETAKTKGVGREKQQLISSGMYGTTTAAGVERGWEAEVGAPARLRLEDVMEQRLTTAQLGMAGAIERREDVYPDYSSLLQMLAR